MKRFFLLLVLFTSLSTVIGVIGQTAVTNTAEVLSVIRLNNVAIGLPNLTASGKHYENFYAKNSESAGLKKSSSPTGDLATHIFQNSFSTNATTLAGPGPKNTSYELLAPINGKGKIGKEQFSQLTFLDSTTVVGIASSETESAFVFIDISGEKMYFTARVSIPKGELSGNQQKLFIDTATHRVFLPVNMGIDKTGNLDLKNSKTTQPGIWILQAVKNEEKKWSINPENIEAYYFPNNWSSYAKNGPRIQTAHADIQGNLWLGFSDGIIGVLPLNQTKEKVYLYNLNKDLSLINSVRTDFMNQMKERLHNSYNDEDTVAIFENIFQHPNAYTAAYLQDARYTTFYNLVQDANSKLGADETVPNEEAYWPYVNLDLDNPLSKSNQKLYDYFGFKVRKFQTLQNGFTSGNDNSVYATTNLGLYKMSFDNKKNAISVVWSTPYTNSFLKDRGEESAGSSTTPAFNADHNEVAICDNDFPYSNLLIIDAKTGKVKNKFMLFDRAYGSASSGGIVFDQNTIVVSNAFGITTGYPANGIMKFSSTTRGSWNIDYDWNTAQQQTIANSATPKISASTDIVYIYHHPENQSWQLSGLNTEKTKGVNSNTFSLAPDFGDSKLNLDNGVSNITIGPQKSIFIGTTNGLLRVKSE